MLSVISDVFNKKNNIFNNLFIHRVRMRIHVFELVHAIMCIYLCRVERCVSQQLLYGHYVSPVLEHVRGKAVPEFVGRDFFVDAGSYGK